VSGNTNFTGATPQTTVPFMVYVGGNTAQQPNPSGIPGALGLMLPVNTPTIVTGFASAPCTQPTSLGLPFSPILPGQCPVTPGTNNASLGAYPIQINVGAGYNDLQLPNPSIIQIVGLNNTSSTPFVVNVPSVVSGALTSVPGSLPLPVGAVTVEALPTPIGRFQSTTRLSAQVLLPRSTRCRPARLVSRAPGRS